MKSIRYKIILLILCSVVISCAIVGTLGIIMTAGVVNDDANRNMNLLCKVNADKLELAFTTIEDSVEMLVHYAEEELGSVEMLKNEDFREKYTANIEKNALHHVEQAKGAIAIYMRYDYDLVGGNEGFFYIRSKDSAKFESEPLTDISAYEKDDMEHVGWWHVPVEAGEPVWMNSYYNENVNLYMFSFVHPVYKDGTLFGVVGIDISIDYVTDIVRNISFYKTGKAAIVESNGITIYHPNIPRGEKIADYYSDFAEVIEELSHTNQTDNLMSYSLDGVNKKLAACNLSNDMILMCFAPDSEIYDKTNILITQVVIMILLSMIIVSVLSIILSRKITEPIKMLNSAAKKLVEGNFDIDVSNITNDEIGELTKTFSEANDYIKYKLKNLEDEAHRDGLTKVGNKFSFLEREAAINACIEEENTCFAVAVFDVNDLKYTNDSFGHFAGDMLLTTVSGHFVKYYGEKNVFRLGGDEFVVISTKDNTDDFERLTGECLETMTKISIENYPGIEVGCACGIAVFDSAEDYIFSDVLRRADREMYKNKPKGKRAAATR